MTKKNVTASDGSAGVLDTRLTKTTGQVIIAGVVGALLGATICDYLNIDLLKKVQNDSKLSLADEEELRRQIAAALEESNKQNALISSLRDELNAVEREDGIHQYHLDEIEARLNSISAVLEEAQQRAENLSADNLRKATRIRELEGLSDAINTLRAEKESIEREISLIVREDGISQEDINAIISALKEKFGMSSLSAGDGTPAVLAAISDYIMVVPEDGISAADVTAAHQWWLDKLSNIFSRRKGLQLAGSKEVFIEKVDELIAEGARLQPMSILSRSPMMPSYGSQGIFELHAPNVTEPLTLKINADSSLIIGSDTIREFDGNGTHMPALIASVLLAKKNRPTSCRLVGSNNNWLSFKGTVAYDGDLNETALLYCLTWLGRAAATVSEADAESAADFLDSVCRGADWANTYSLTRGISYKRAATVASVLGDFEYNGVGITPSYYNGPVTKERIVAMSALLFSCFNSGREYEVKYS